MGHEVSSLLLPLYPYIEWNETFSKSLLHIPIMHSLFSDFDQINLEFSRIKSWALSFMNMVTLV